ncbi:MAG TPA: LysM peptidoglycan-binding domain-containing protein, partial [Ornithinibacter sp.]|nr:LysM peptidoglycan-binding domain-containing protein [Ornithinibacter sp.]
MVISAPPATAPPVAQLPASVVAAANPAPHGWTSYTVRDGDTLIGIAARFRTTVGVIAAKNEIRTRHLILAGTTLSVPRTAAAKATGGGTASRVHVVRSGDTLIGIAQRYRVPLTSLLKANRLRASAFIHPGQKVVVRGAAASATAARSAAKGTAHTVRSGDTLGAIAIRHRTSVAAIARASGISTRAILHPG